MHRMITHGLSLCIALAISGVAAAENLEVAANNWPETQRTVVVEQEHLPEYRALAAEIGFDYDYEYGYSEWADLKRDNDLGVAGEYEWLACSVSNESWGCSSDGNGWWEAMYYSNHDVTAVWQIRHEGERSFVKLLKIEQGRAPDIHRR